ncbi:MAG TPA: sugar phosphate isomerase/epimerase, partial [Clostridiaceae bacterium]|nr:sugar phosphate isomerase/epimerase [Clostridiaceae bacterium]
MTSNPLPKRIRFSGFSDEISSDLDVQLEEVTALGMSYISLRGIDGKNIGEYTPEEFREKVLPRLNQKDVRVSSIGSPIGKVFIDDEPGFLKQQETLRNLCQICKLLETRYIRVFSFYIPKGENPDLYKEEVLKKLGVFVQIAREYGIMLIHENEKDIYGDTKERCLTLFRALDPAAFRGIFDFANFVQVGEDTMSCYSLLKDHIEYIHIKDAVTTDKENVVAGTGEGKIKEILKAFLLDGYEGFLTLEPHLVLFDSLKDLELEEATEVIKDSKGLEGKDGYRLQYEATLDILREIMEELKWKN